MMKSKIVARAKFNFPNDDPRSQYNGIELVRYAHWSENTHPVYGDWQSWAIEGKLHKAVAVYSHELAIVQVSDHA